jgi:hypothetical protein
MDFINYVLSFYGVGGIYEHGWSDQQIIAACEVRMGMVEYAGDSIDREWVRDYLFGDVTIDNPYPVNI